MNASSPPFSRFKAVLQSPELARVALAVAVGWIAKSMLVALKYGEPATAQLSQQFVQASQALLHIALAACAFMAFSRRLSPLAMAGCAIAGTLVSRWGWIDVGLHGFFVEASLYPPLFVHVAPDGSVNPQYAKLLLFAVFAPLLAYRVARPDQRTLDRIFVLTATGAVLATSAIFHAVVPNGSLKQQKVDAQYVLGYATQLQGEDLQRYCRYLAVHCAEVRTREEATALLSQTGINPSWVGITEALKPGSVALGISAAMDGMRFIVRGVAYRAPSDKAPGVLVVDKAHLQNAQHAAEIQLSLMAVLAHGIWLLLAFGLTALHASKKRFLLSRPKTAEAAA